MEDTIQDNDFLCMKILHLFLALPYPESCSQKDCEKVNNEIKHIYLTNLVDLL